MKPGHKEGEEEKDAAGHAGRWLSSKKRNANRNLSTQLSGPGMDITSI